MSFIIVNLNPQIHKKKYFFLIIFITFWFKKNVKNYCIHICLIINDLLTFFS